MNSKASFFQQIRKRKEFKIFKLKSDSAVLKLFSAQFSPGAKQEWI
jgi:hypothetical protein